MRIRRSAGVHPSGRLVFATAPLFRRSVPPSRLRRIDGLADLNAGWNHSQMYYNLYLDFVGYVEVWGQVSYWGASDRATRAARPEPSADPSGSTVPLLKA